MAGYRLSHRAQRELFDIARFTERHWGSEQAFKYLRELRAAFELLAERPKLGRPVHKSYPGKRRMEVASHVVFFREEGDGILVQRILHKNRKLER